MMPQFTLITISFRRRRTHVRPDRGASCEAVFGRALGRGARKDTVSIVKTPKALTERPQEGEVVDSRDARGGTESLVVAARWVGVADVSAIETLSDRQKAFQWQGLSPHHTNKPTMRCTRPAAER
ncbi:hypothetical protein TgHK011_003396 [Trichoderma gracile]|nr:hypothetical protein TgHK011_003396 [Trichoderma gracile]